MTESTEPLDMDREEQLLVELLREGVPAGVLPSTDHTERLRQLIGTRTVAVRSAAPRWAIGVGLAAAASFLLLLFGLDGFRRQDSWAQVVKTLHERPWLHSVHRFSNGMTDEFWLSFTTQIAARKSPGRVWYEDHRAGIRDEYEVASEKLMRLPATDPDRQKSMVDAFRAIFRNDEKVGDSFADFRIVSQRRRDVERDGRKWIEYELKTAQGTQVVTLTIEVDPLKNLPVSMTTQSDKHTETYELDFPNEGPADIYALGVPRDAKVDVRLPPAEVAHVLQALKLGRDGPHVYFSVVLQGEIPQAFVWRKGNRWRVEMCLARGQGSLRPPRPDENLVEWRQQYNQIPTVLCDGRTVYRNHSGARDEQPGWKLLSTLAPGSESAAESFAQARQSMAEVQAYPSLAPAARMDLTFDGKPAEGPAGTLLLTQTARGDMQVGAYRTSRYWVDPAVGFAVVRYEYSDLVTAQDAAERPGLDPDIYELADFVKSPQGIWYPSTIRRKNAVEGADQDGHIAKTDEVWKFMYDFAADVPDELFRVK